MTLAVIAVYLTGCLAAYRWLAPPSRLGKAVGVAAWPLVAAAAVLGAGCLIVGTALALPLAWTGCDIVGEEEEDYS